MVKPLAKQDRSRLLTTETQRHRENQSQSSSKHCILSGLLCVSVSLWLALLLPLLPLSFCGEALHADLRAEVRDLALLAARLARQTHLAAVHDQPAAEVQPLLLRHDVRERQLHLHR